MIAYRQDQQNPEAQEEAKSSGDVLKSQNTDETILFHYERSLIQNHIQLTYDQVDHIISNCYESKSDKDETSLSSTTIPSSYSKSESGETSILKQLRKKHTNIDMDELFENIGILDELMKKRREFRG